MQLTESQVQAVIDTVFGFVESKEGPLLKLLTNVLQQAADLEVSAITAAINAALAAL